MFVKIIIFKLLNYINNQTLIINIIINIINSLVTSIALSFSYLMKYLIRIQLISL